MKLQNVLLAFCLMLVFQMTTQAQDSAYVGYWEISVPGVTDKCAKTQSIDLRKDGTATYSYGDIKGCKAQLQTFETWKVETREFRVRKGKTVKKKVIAIGKHDSMLFVVMKKKGKTIEVAADAPSGDTTTFRPIVLTKVKKKK